MGTMGAKEVGDPPAAGPITVQPFRQTEFAAPTAAEPVVPPSPPTQRIDRSQLPKADDGDGSWGARLLQRLQQKDLPVLGGRPLAQQVQALLLLLVLFAVLAVVAMVLGQRGTHGPVGMAGELSSVTLNSQRMVRAAGGALEGNAAAIAELRSSRDEVNAALQSLGRTASGPAATELARFADSWKPLDAAAGRIVAQERSLLAFGALRAAIDTATPRLATLTEEVAAIKLQQGATASRDAALIAQLAAAVTQMNRTASDLTAGRAGADAGQALERDIGRIRDNSQTLLAGATEGDARSRLQEIAKIGGEIQAAASTGLAGVAAVAEAAAAGSALQAEAEPLRQRLASLQAMASGGSAGGLLYVGAAAVFVLLLLATVLALMQVLLRGSRRRALEAEAQRLEAQRLEQAAKRANEQNQAAILRLMNELQEVADGNLMVQATVSEDITGAIADSVNYTVEELRGLVGRINEAAEQVNGASTEAREIATRLMTTSETQARELKDTGSNVLQMTAQIGEVSRAAGESARVAKVSLEAAERGQRAVYNQIAGMNEIREQIQETAKRIKRLGESSQEIGEIVELISDITEQTNVLALNAAIQAVSAGEAGRGFSVVAEEVQRLADRSAEAAKQIAALVKTIQTDTQDAVAAMEKSTQGVVEGTKLSDAAGTALADIGRVSRQLAELIERIAGSTQEQASSADGVAHAIARILSDNEQTTDGTRRAADAIGQLASLARELKESVARFRVA
jgi:twitching motility protein PilJ